MFTGLRDSYHVLALEHGWDTVSLDWGWHIISAQLDIAQHHWMEASILKLRQSVSVDQLCMCWTGIPSVQVGPA